MARPLFVAKIVLGIVACATVIACSQSAASKKSGDGDDDTGDDFGGSDDPNVPPPRTPNVSNDDSGAFSPGGRKSTGSSADAGRGTDPVVDAGGAALSACTDGVQPGDVKIVEFMISSAAGSGDKGEWVELQSTRTDCILDVDNLTISSPRGTSVDTVTITDGLTLNPGDTFLVADSDQPTTNNDLTTPLYSWESSDVLKNDGDEIDVTLAGTVIDTLTYPSFGNLETGNSVSFPSDCEWTDRSDWTRWSYSFNVYSGVLAGTPNAPNDDVTCF